MRSRIISDTKLSNYSGLSVHYLNIFYGEARFFCYFCINNRINPGAPGTNPLQTTAYTMSLIKEFKDFAMRGNVVDMAVGVIIGAAFGKIVSSLVDDIIMPLVGVVTGGMDFTDLKWVIQKGITEGETVIQPEVTMNYGAWIQTVVDFIIVAFCIFVMIKFMNQLRKKKEEAPAPAPAPEPTKEEQLLTEIRDLLKERK